MSSKSKIEKMIKLFRSKEMIPIPKLMNSQKLLEGKVALITGGSGGIGFAIAKAFLEHGCKVIIAGTNEKKLRNCEEQLKEYGKFCDYIILDVLDVKSMTEKIWGAAAKFPEDKIDILVNSAGLNGQKNFENMTEEEYDAIMDVNVKGTYFMSQIVGQLMIEKKIKGHILNIASSSSLRPASTPYCISKWAVRGMTLGLADVLLPYGIVVNAIAPGSVVTPMLGKKEGDPIDNPNAICGRYAVPQEIASLAVFMVSDLGNLIVRDTYFITGGSGLISLHH